MAANEAGSSRYWLNRALFDLSEVANRDAFAADKQAYFARYPLGSEERAVLSEPRWQALLDRGALPNLVFKYYMLHGLPPESFAEVVKGEGHG